MEASSRRILNQGVKGLGIWRARRAWAVGCGLKKIKNTDPVNWALKVEQHRHHGRKTSKKWSPPIQSRKVYVLKNLTYLRWVTILVRSRRKPRKTGWNQTMEDFEFWRFRVGKHSWGVRFWAGNDNRLDWQACAGMTWQGGDRQRRKPANQKTESSKAGRAWRRGPDSVPSVPIASRALVVQWGPGPCWEGVFSLVRRWSLQARGGAFAKSWGRFWLLRSY